MQKFDRYEILHPSSGRIRARHILGSDRRAAEAAPPFADCQLPRDWFHPEEPQHKVILTRPMYFGIHEVRQREYEPVMGMNPSRFSPSGLDKVRVASLETGKFPSNT